MRGEGDELATDVYSEMGRLKMIKLCKEQALDYGPFVKDDEGLRKLLRAAGEDGENGAAATIAGATSEDGEDGAASIASGEFGGFEEDDDTTLQQSPPPPATTLVLKTLATMHRRRRRRQQQQRPRPR
jgi:hypothetical protein